MKFKEFNLTAFIMFIFGVVLGVILSLQIHLHYQLEKYNERLDWIEQELDFMNEMILYYDNEKLDLYYNNSSATSFLS
jgi:hypothetical protein|tara:strand:- start:66 stop:299 length:234 start_codon:yes stop_codon:yes gene_type:complete